MNHLKIEIKEVSEAPNYNKENGWNGAELTKAVIVPKGMDSGAPSVDLQFVTDKGNFVTMTTFGLIEGLYHAMKGVNERK